MNAVLNKRKHLLTKFQNVDRPRARGRTWRRSPHCSNRALWRW